MGLLKNILLEKIGDSYEYGCAMLNVSLPQIKDIHSKIDKEDVYTETGDRSFGLEDEPHITILYGLHPEVTADQVKEKLKPFLDRLTPLKIYNVSLFKNEKYDVLKFDVGYLQKGGAYLSKMNKSLRELPYTSNFPDYHPHLTIGYLKPGMGEKYVKLFKGLEYELNPSDIVYSDANKNKTKIERK